MSNVIDQGYAYLALMLNNKADFILEYNKNCNSTIKRDDVAWSQSRVIFVFPSFNNYQKESINFKDLPFELWEVKRFINDTMYFNPIKASRNATSKKSISTTNEEINIVNKEVKVITEENHYKNGSEETIELYESIREYILSLDSNLIINCRDGYIGFDINNKNLYGITLLRKSLKFWINARLGELDDLKNIFRDVSKTGHWGNGDYEIQISNDKNIEYIFSLIKQFYKKRNLG